MVHIAAVSPIYNAEDCVDELYIQLRQALSAISEDFEIILVDDNSRDDSWYRMQKIAERDPKVKCLRLSKNFGQHNAISAGLDAVDSKWTVVIDCDLQEPPAEIKNLYEKGQEGYDIVYTIRQDRKETFFRLFWGRIFNFACRLLSSVVIDREIGNLSLISRKVVVGFRRYEDHFREYISVLHHMGFRSTKVKIQHQKRFGGTSSYSFMKRLKLGVDTIVTFSVRPLYIFAGLGIVISFFSLLTGVYLIAKRLIYGDSLTEWTTLMVSIYFLSGIILMAAGTLGLYLGRTFTEAKKRPLYLIAEQLNYAKS